MPQHNASTCPCKRLPQCLSSFTAAEYGNLEALLRLGPSVADRRDAGGYSPLHLAAQNGHVAATCLLLKLGAHVDGKPSSRQNAGPTCGATPLHRASYAGAVSTMKILLEWNQTERCDVVARDTSFGDNMTPLHKAVAGGRYLAVRLLVDTIRKRDREDRVVIGDLSSLLYTAMNALDSQGRTPIAVAREFLENQEERRQGVRRWDAVAGGRADWEKCEELLLDAEAELCTWTEEGSAIRNNRTSRNVDGRSLEKLDPIPTHLVAGSASCCLDCSTTGDGQCLTASWEAAFQRVLSESVDLTLGTQKSIPIEVGRSSTGNQRVPAIETKSLENHTEEDTEHMSNDRLNKDSRVGRRCDSCDTACFAVCQDAGGNLVCRSCANRRKKSNNK